MRKPIKALLLAAVLAGAPAAAQAESRGMQESRFINGTVGAIAGALVGGPIGLIAGAAIGYTVGPEIAGPQATWGNRRVARRHARRKRARAVQVAQAQNCPCYPQAAAVYPQQAYPQQAYQQPVYMAPAQTGYTPLPGQPQPAAQQRFYNPRQNALVPSPEMFAAGGQYSAALSAPTAPGQQGASGAYAGSYSAPPPQGYGYGQVQAAPVPMPR